MACRNRCASHHPSLSSVLCPLRTFTSCGLANNTFTASSKTLKTGFQYDPVLSITTCVTSSCFSQSRSRSSSAIIVPNRRVCFRASPCNGPVITQTAKNSFPTSMPAHRSTAAQIMSALLLWTGEQLTSSWNTFLHGSTAPFGGASRLPGQFRFRGKVRAITYYSRLLQSCNGLYSSPIFISWGGQNRSSPFVSCKRGIGANFSAY